MTQATLDLHIPIPHPTEPGYLPTWIADQLNGRTPNTGHRTARFHACHRCTAIVITGLDDHVMATTVTADPTPLDTPAIRACQLINRRLYTAWRRTTGYELTPYTPTAHQPTIPAHHCGARFPTFLEHAIPLPTDHPSEEPPPF